ncbi:MAG TPA: hypothetical protein ENN73_06980 [Firmicutes bacterium]|mgnify:CR=1 FL=1|nr:hypothetical protein [Bacillota bacterium]
MKVFLFIFTGILILVSTAGLGNCEDILVILSSNIKPYNECFDGLKSSVSGTVEKEYFPENKAGLEELISRIIKTPPKVLVLIGSKAFDGISSEIRDVPIVFTMVLNPKFESGQNNITGLTMNIDLKVRINYLKKIMPDAKKIGIIITPEIRKNYLRKIDELESGNSCQFTKLEVETEGELFKRLKELEGNADCILLFPDQMLLDENNFSVLLLFSFQNNIPLIGVSPKYVKMGALYGLYSDYRNSGKEAGNIVKKILSGKSPAFIPIEDIKEPELIFNKKISKKMNLKISDEIIKSAKTVYD